MSAPRWDKSDRPGNADRARLPQVSEALDDYRAFARAGFSGHLRAD